MTRFHHSDPAGGALTYHGGRLDVAAERFQSAPQPWIDLSTGISPFAWPTERLAAPDLRALPSPAALAALGLAAAEHFGAPAVPIAALPGSEIGLRMLGSIDPPRPWRVVGPGYRSHLDALPGAMAIAPESLDDEAGLGGTILLANPNNPDGISWQPDRLIAVARRLGERGGLLIVDEAFGDALPDTSILPLIERDDPVLVFRSFGKFFGLAGVRLGFVAGEANRVARLADRLGSWPVSALAIACGTAAYRDTRWIAAACVRQASVAADLDAVLARHGLAARGACPLFRLVETEAAPEIFDRLGRSGILVRPFDDAPRWLRFGLPADDEAMRRLDEALGNG
ncbi:L-threonine O-3-phosphate decarboxylase [Sphingomonas gellani]|uniref:L-threonine O-3-phosphate decarboxylase n=1 Tax=Sphingomonas gellani TaxID=1166340 RepID=A0A1H8CRA6_9SPHN|nr:aminotransferase class I/II-fold pyridoxal phosphate-dependent enzyme [Sphingomonas gellani]SEM97516.1 L-threonine O-3-phosphate decarboxylase [Sphingomonas gellani]